MSVKKVASVTFIFIVKYIKITVIKLIVAVAVVFYLLYRNYSLIKISIVNILSYSIRSAFCFKILFKIRPHRDIAGVSMKLTQVINKLIRR